MHICSALFRQIHTLVFFYEKVWRNSLNLYNLSHVDRSPYGTSIKKRPCTCNRSKLHTYGMYDYNLEILQHSRKPELYFLNKVSNLANFSVLWIMNVLFWLRFSKFYDGRLTNYAKIKACLQIDARFHNSVIIFIT